MRIIALQRLSIEELSRQDDSMFRDLNDMEIEVLRDRFTEYEELNCKIIDLEADLSNSEDIISDLEYDKSELEDREEGLQNRIEELEKQNTILTDNQK